MACFRFRKLRRVNVCPAQTANKKIAMNKLLSFIVGGALPKERLPAVIVPFGTGILYYWPPTSACVCVLNEPMYRVIDSLEKELDLALATLVYRCL